MVKLSTNSDNLLETSAVTLQKNLNDREAFVQNFLNDTANYTKLKNIKRDEAVALQLIQSLSKEKKLFFFTYRNNKLDFWSTIHILPDSLSKYKTGVSFIYEKNGYYEVVKKVYKDFSVLFFIEIKSAYAYHNQYLNNGFSIKLLNNDYLDIAKTGQKHAIKITSLDHRYLFSVQLNQNRQPGYLSLTQNILWGLSILILFVLVFSLCSYIADRGYVKWAILCAALFVTACAFINLHFHWINLPLQEKTIPILQLKGIYSPFLSVSDIAVSIVFATWFAVFVYSKRKIAIRPVLKPIKAYSLFFLTVFFLTVLSVVFATLFCNLIIDSNIQFDIDNLLNLTFYNFIGTAMLCLAYLIFYLFAETGIVICSKLNIPDKNKLLVFVLFILLVTFWDFYTKGYFTWFYLLWASVVAWRAYNVYYENGRMPALAYVIILGVSSLISTIKLTHIQDQREEEKKYVLIRQLVNTSDPGAEYIFHQVEKSILIDSNLIAYFSKADKNEVYLKNHLRQMYFDDYLSKYDFTMYVYDSQLHNISGQQDYELNVFKSQVNFGALKVEGTNYFYRQTNGFGERRYFALLPISSGHELKGMLVVDLKSNSLESVNPFLPLLADGKLEPQNKFKNYSFAFYKDNKLINQNGKYEYKLINTVFKGKLKGYSSLETTDPNYRHLLYQPNQRNMVVVSRADNNLQDMLSVFIFFFLIFLVFTLLVISVYWIWSNVSDLNFNHFLWSLRVSANSLLYKTRIQIFMVGSVVVTLLIVGVVTFITFKNQDKKQQDDLNHEKIKKIAADYETQMVESKMSGQEELELKFNAFAETYSVDLMLYDTTGVPLLYTEPKLYDKGIIGNRMNAVAFIKMKRLQKSELVNDEQIGSFYFTSAYVPVHKAPGEVVGFLQLPYFSNEADYKARIGYFINSMINVYALVLVAIGLFAVFIAKRITAPLNLIQQGLSNTMYGRKNEPINWKRNDEIGSLIKEYNKMIASLELNAARLAKSERESAWREMAKQIAHEIKNPLTPLKLGLQLLSKAWRDNDPRFDQKFQKFSSSFIEQIESLSRIATEFSDFAKLPDAKPEVVNIFEVISRATDVFDQSENIRIEYTPTEKLYLIRTDKDQLLRCFNNLLKNAIEAIPVGRNGLINIGYHISKEHIQIDITDNGNGIPENVRENIFQPNFTTKSSGTGLGLAFIKNVIENTGGKIWFETEIGEGTTFHLLFRSASLPTLI